MKTKLLLLAIPMFGLSSCFFGDNAPSSDDANDAAGTGSPYLAREVAGVHMLTNDANYDEPCNILGEEFVRSAFKLGATTELTELDHPNGCEFEWGGNKVAMAFGGPKPYPSIYHAEYIYDKMYQGGARQVSGQMGTTAEKPAISGPETEGTGAERPAIEPKGGAEADVDEDASADNDSSNSISGVTSVAAQFTKPVVSAGRFEAVPGVGDKAVWDPSKGALHVLYNNHIINITVRTKDKPEVRKQRAESLAEVLIDKVAEGHYSR